MTFSEKTWLLKIFKKKTGKNRFPSILSAIPNQPSHRHQPRAMAAPAASQPCSNPKIFKSHVFSEKVTFYLVPWVGNKNCNRNFKLTFLSVNRSRNASDMFERCGGPTFDSVSTTIGLTPRHYGMIVRKAKRIKAINTASSRHRSHVSFTVV